MIRYESGLPQDESFQQRLANNLYMSLQEKVEFLTGLSYRRYLQINCKAGILADQ